MSATVFTVWVGGVELNDHYLGAFEAETIAESWRDDGYDDVVVEELYAEYDCDRCGAETPDGHGYYYKGERLCRECAEVHDGGDDD